MIRFLSAVLLWLVSAAVVLAEVPILSATEARARMAAGELLVLDIRTRQEWAETGIAEGAWPVSMHERDFGERLQAILAKYPADQIALICATGGRSGHVTKVLAQSGIVGIADVSEGMLGNPRGPGWVARGYGVQTIKAATNAMSEVMAR